MLIFLLIVVLWVTCTLRYVVMGRVLRNKKHWCGLILFPLAFMLLALSQWVFRWHTLYKGMETSGYPDEWLHIQEVLVITRSTLMIVVAGAISLLATAGPRIFSRYCVRVK